MVDDVLKDMLGEVFDAIERGGGDDLPFANGYESHPEQATLRASRSPAWSLIAKTSQSLPSMFPSIQGTHSGHTVLTPNLMEYYAFTIRGGTGVVIGHITSRTSERIENRRDDTDIQPDYCRINKR